MQLHQNKTRLVIIGKPAEILKQLKNLATQYQNIGQILRH